MVDKEVEYWWSKFPELTKEEVKVLLKACHEQRDCDEYLKLYMEHNNEAT